VGLHNAESERLKDHFGPSLLPPLVLYLALAKWDEAGSSLRSLRGCKERSPFDLYNHIDLKELKEAYLACIPQLGV
jgi:integrase/recombinase XerD